MKKEPTKSEQEEAEEEEAFEPMPSLTREMDPIQSPGFATPREPTPDILRNFDEACQKTTPTVRFDKNGHSVVTTAGGALNKPSSSKSGRARSPKERAHSSTSKAQSTSVVVSPNNPIVPVGLAVATSGVTALTSPSVMATAVVLSKNELSPQFQPGSSSTSSPAVIGATLDPTRKKKRKSTSPLKKLKAPLLDHSMPASLMSETGPERSNPESKSPSADKLVIDDHPSGSSTTVTSASDFTCPPALSVPSRLSFDSSTSSPIHPPPYLPLEASLRNGGGGGTSMSTSTQAALQKLHQQMQVAAMAAASNNPFLPPHLAGPIMMGPKGMAGGLTLPHHHHHPHLQLPCSSAGFVPPPTSMAASLQPSVSIAVPLLARHHPTSAPPFGGTPPVRKMALPPKSASTSLVPANHGSNGGPMSSAGQPPLFPGNPFAINNGQNLFAIVIANSRANGSLQATNVRPTSNHSN